MRFDILAKTSADIVLTVEGDSLEAAVLAALGRGENFKGTNLAGLQVPKLSVSTPVCLEECDLSGINLAAADLRGCQLSDTE